MDQPEGKRKGEQRMFGGGERKGTLFFLQLHGAEQERIKSGTVLCFFQGSLCLWLLAQTSPTQEEEKQSYEIGWSLRLLQSNDKEGDADNAVALKWHFQRLHKGEKGKAGDGLNNCHLASGPSRWEERAMDGYPYREAKHPKGSAKVFSCRLLLVSLFPHEYIFAVSTCWEKNYLQIPIPGQMQDVQF